MHRTCPLLGVKQTWVIAPHMSANDPKRTSPFRMCQFNWYDTVHWASGAMMRRRDFIKAIAASAAVWPLTAQAQQKLSQIGILLIGGPEPMGPFYEALRHRGYVEGRNIQYVIRSAE